MKETPTQRKAFEYYYSLGDKRNLKKVAEKFGYSYDTIRGWSSKLRWRERIYQYEKKQLQEIRRAREELSEESKEYYADLWSKYLKACSLTLEGYIESIENGGEGLTLQTSKDLHNLGLAIALGLGDPTEIHEHRESGGELEDLLEDLVSATKNLKDEGMDEGLDDEEAEIEGG